MNCCCPTKKSELSINNGGITIKLNNVEKGSEVFEAIDIIEASKEIEDYFDRPGEEDEDDYCEKAKRELDGAEPTLKYKIGLSNHPLIRNQSFRHSYISAVLTAYNNHLPFEFSPDDIWALISFGVAQHLGGDKDLAETYRKVFVDHEGKNLLSVDGTGIVDGIDSEKNKVGWPVIVEELCNLIKSNTKTDLADIMTTPFSTSGSVEVTVYNCFLMDAMKNYFDYECITLCGIPEVIVYGTVEDWHSILDRLQNLEKIFPDFKWYFNRVSKHVSKIVSTVEGKKPHLKWWNSMIFEYIGGIFTQSGGQPKLFGWIVEFIPYIFEGDKRKRNEGRVKVGEMNSPAVSLTDFVFDDNGTEYNMKLCGGFIGVSQNIETKAVRPAMGWIVYHNQGQKALEHETAE